VSTGTSWWDSFLASNLSVSNNGTDFSLCSLVGPAFVLDGGNPHVISERN
jgi:hypothetical protein